MSSQVVQDSYHGQLVVLGLFLPPLLTQLLVPVDLWHTIQIATFPVNQL